MRKTIITATIAGATLLISPQLGWAADDIKGDAPQATGQQPSTPPADKKDGKDEPLSKKLDKNDGVLKPPSGVDPKIHKDPPDNVGDRMPVIVPPGEPGGNQDVQPK